MKDSVNKNHNFNYEIVLSRKDNIISLRIPALGLLTSGDDIAIVYQDILNKKEIYLANAEKADLLDTLPLPVSSGVPSSSASAVVRTAVIKGDLRSFLAKTAILCVVLVGLIGVVSLSIKSSVQIPVGKKFWGRVEEGLHQAALPGQGLTPQEMTLVKGDLHALVQKYKPLVDEVRPLLGGDSTAECR